MSKINFIDDDKEHNQVLYELGILDDDDNWKLYCKMQAESINNEIDTETWCKYRGIKPRKIPKD
jgi:hypothetical protein